MKSFQELIKAQWRAKQFLCVGLDPDLDKLPTPHKNKPAGEALFCFCREIVDAVAPFCAAYKPNSAFYEGYGAEGWEALRQTIHYIKEKYPSHPVILDAKRGDVGHSNAGYVRAAFDLLRADAITVHPYLGEEAVRPFLEREDRGVFVLCHTSNPGAAEFQELNTEGMPLYINVAKKVSSEWNKRGNCGLVVGATYPEQLAEVREKAPELPFLVPGVGAQGGDLEKTVRYGMDYAGGGIVINASRGVIYASNGDDFATAAAREAEKLTLEIRGIMDGMPKK